MKPIHIKHLQSKSRNLRARWVDKNTIAVESLTNPAANHIVVVHFDEDNTIHARCTCPWAIKGGIACTHVMAALDYLASLKGRRLSFWRTREEAKRQRHAIFHLVNGDDGDDDDGVWITSRAA
ncbi:MAG: SWIM zinc finger family protein [Chloroflexi bacterium]|nr:MAG: SWIM zinc finger family protein [Chloroflexota bacterium]